jgi:hypothetical protein
MSETAGFGADIPAWLPAAAARSVAAAELVAQRESRQAGAQREARAESARARAIESFRAAAELRGEVISPMALATGAGLGRTLAQILAEAGSQASRIDAQEAARVRREGTGPLPQLEHVEFAEPVIHSARSETGLKIFNVGRHFRDRLAARRAAESAERTADHFSLRQPVELRRP